MSTDKNDNDKAPNFVVENGVLRNTQALPAVSQHNNYGDVLLECMSSNLAHVGQVDGLTGRKETFSEMMEKSVKCAIWLKKENIQPRDVIGICIHNQMDMYVPYCASLYVGAISNARWDVGLNEDQVKYFINMTKPKILFANEVTATIVRKVVEEMDFKMKIVVFGGLPGLQSLDDILSSQDNKLLSEFRSTKLSSPDDPAIIVFTSGSSGLPKGALFSHLSLNVNISRFGETGAIEGPITSMNFSPMSWISGLFCMLKGIVRPHTRIVYPKYVAETCLDLIEKYKVNWMFLGVSMAFSLQKSPVIMNYDLSSVKLIILSGAVVKEEMQKTLTECFPSAFISQSYGSTEIGGAGVKQSRNYKSGSCGTVAAYLSMKIVDPATGQILGPNQEGEACFKTLYMMNGYYEDPEETSKVIDSEGWLHSGDLMSYDENGNVFYIDRIKELVRFRGIHISPAMTEQVLQDHPAVKEVAVLSVPDMNDGDHPIAFVSKVPNAQVTEEDLKELVSDTLPDYMKLRGGVHFCDELLHTSSGKIARAELKKLIRSTISS